MTSWAVALDAFEARLDAQRTSLDGGEAGTLAPFAPPPDLGPLPVELATRAKDLLARSEDLVRELADDVVGLSHDLAVVRALETSTATPRQANFVDFSA